MSNKKDLKNITRFEIEPKSPSKAGQFGWWVRMQRNGVKFHHFFNDNKYNGKLNSLKAAKQFRDAVKIENIALFGEKSTNPLSNASKQSVSGYVGVNRACCEYSKRGKKYKAELWQAHWPLGNGKHGRASFSIKKYGEEEAFRLAYEARQQGLKDVDEREKDNIDDLRYYPPENTNQKTWRYLDFTKFISMLDSKSLFFPPASSFSDQFEGSYSKANIEIRPLINKNNMEDNKQSIDMENLKSKVGISCWHANEYESAAMWELYSKSTESVCVQSTYQRLVLSIEEKAEIGMVQYVDYSNDFIPEYDPFLAFFHKRKSFEHENELRAIIKDLKKNEIGVGRNIPVELELLIENIYVSPDSPEWFFKLVERTVKKYGLSKKVIKSSLADDPIY